MGNGSEKDQKFNRQVVPWVVTSVSVGTSIAFAVALSTSTPEAAKTVLDFAGKLLGPMGAAAIAWAGVHHTIRNTRRQDELKVKQDQLKEWYVNLRWAADLCSSSSPGAVAIGVATLDSIDGLPFLGEQQQSLIDQILEAVVESDGDSLQLGDEHANLGSHYQKEARQ